MRRILFLALALSLSQPACVVAGGYSSDSGFYIWPGSILTIVVIIAVLFLLWRRRGR
jgi:hypothetical protein